MTSRPTEQLFIRCGGVVRGPFNRTQLDAIREKGQLPDDAEFSHDKRNWERAASPVSPASSPLPAPGDTASSEPEQPISPPPLRLRPANDHQTDFVAEPKAPPLQPPPENRHGDVPFQKVEFYRVEPAGQPEQWTALQLLGDTIAMLWNSSDFLRHLSRRGTAAAVWSACFAVLLAFGLCGYALLLFASRFPCTPTRLALTSAGLLGGALIFYYLGFSLIRLCREKQPESMPALDLAAAAFGTLQLAHLLTLTLALAFLLNPKLYHLPTWGVKATLLGISACALFCIGQTLSGFRSSFTGTLAIAPGRATRISICLLWPSLAAAGYFLIPCLVCLKGA